MNTLVKLALKRSLIVSKSRKKGQGAFLKEAMLSFGGMLFIVKSYWCFKMIFYYYFAILATGSGFVWLSFNWFYPVMVLAFC